MEQKIAALEEYCLNVDYTRFPVPKPLEYLFKKTTGTYEFHDNNPPVDKFYREILPVMILKGKYEYEGELINGKPGGNGTIKYGEKKGLFGTYSCTYTGTFLNGMKHGNGQLEVKGSGSDVCIYQQRYSYDKKDGIFVIKYDNDRTISTPYVDDTKRNVMKFEAEDGKIHRYTDMKDDLWHGHLIDYTIDEKIETTQYKEGRRQEGSVLEWTKNK
jgi:hypothetical protein